jgi:dUTP pyrophosphatase
MKEVKLITVVNKSDNLLPQYSTEGAFAMDLRSAQDITIPYGETVVVKTGLFMAVPKGYALRIVGRSGLSSKGLIISNAPGTIDEDYRGEVGIIMTNLAVHYVENGKLEGISFGISKQERIAQCYLEAKIPFSFVKVDSLDETARGEGGFGHTGTK